MEPLTREDGHRLLEASAQRNLGISAEEFTKGWKSGELRGRRAERVAMLLPLGTYPDSLRCSPEEIEENERRALEGKNPQ